MTRVSAQFTFIPWLSIRTSKTTSHSMTEAAKSVLTKRSISWRQSSRGCMARFFTCTRIKEKPIATQTNSGSFSIEAERNKATNETGHFEGVSSETRKSAYHSKWSISCPALSHFESTGTSMHQMPRRPNANFLITCFRVRAFPTRFATQKCQANSLFGTGSFKRRPVALDHENGHRLGRVLHLGGGFGLQESIKCGTKRNF